MDPALSASRPALYYSPLYTEAISADARFPRMRYRMVHDALEARGAWQCSGPKEPPLATRAELVSVHDDAYVDAFLQGRLPPEAQRRVGLRPWLPAIVPRTLRVLGATVAASRDALDSRAGAGNLAGGTHHAHRDFGSGYCIFNDIAVAAAMAPRERGLDRILVIDLDVHQGDGTAAIFAKDPRVFTWSVHCAENFPFRKQHSDLDCPLPEGSGDARYLAAIDAQLDRLLERQRPQLVFFQGGVDALAADHLGRLRVSRGGLRTRNERVLGALEAQQIPHVVLMGGGYANPLQDSIECHADLFQRLLEGPGHVASRDADGHMDERHRPEPSNDSMHGSSIRESPRAPGKLAQPRP